ncbi:hypothetical protein [Mycolicibacterium litorale]|uniref:hypothetical protein n=1 Tax=Mycolicibacterium litorale TaxID=758802 RepID=UPI0039A17F27
MAEADQADLQAWWNKLAEDQRERLQDAVLTYPADPSILELLTSTGCPIKDSWAMTSWTSAPENPPAITLHGPLAEFIEDQLDAE